MLGQQRVQLASGHCWADVHGQCTLVEGDLSHIGKVDKERIIAHAPGSPTVLP
ncbi:MAG TPA: hypothetical protein VFB12_06470 [Ktedonobacteraceae bacterium]|nr:hypothetical protein [Ktedonobacteraceae bacterium]